MTEITNINEIDPMSLFHLGPRATFYPGLGYLVSKDDKVKQVVFAAGFGGFYIDDKEIISRVIKTSLPLLSDDELIKQTDLVCSRLKKKALENMSKRG